ncbi:hypothetical protein GOBAR_DD00131 [Gossypium barbadense]|nr:hypothetical protein GOBAR_DD00131 [Gossypium barbadense]
MRNYISYAMTLLQEKGAKKIVLKATSRAINKTVMIAELIMVYGALHMTVKISLMWNSKMVIDGGEDTTVATSWLEARNLVAVPCIWINYTLYEELDARDMERTRDVYSFNSDLIYCSFDFDDTGSQICHRDLKLENTLLDGSLAPRLKICDFGYSKSSLFHSRPKSTVGTLAYIAPEVLARREYDGKICMFVFVSNEKQLNCTCRVIENEYLGLRNGILDQSAILLSSHGCLTYMNCKFRQSLERMPVCDTWKSYD